MPGEIGDYKKELMQMSKAIKNVKTKIADEVRKDIKGEEGYNDKEKQMKCNLVRKVMHEGMEMYKEGEMTFEEFVEDLYKTLQAIK